MTMTEILKCLGMWFCRKPKPRSALEALEERLAIGDIGMDEFLDKRRMLGAGRHFEPNALQRRVMLREGKITLEEYDSYPDKLDPDSELDPAAVAAGKERLRLWRAERDAEEWREARRQLRAIAQDAG